MTVTLHDYWRSSASFRVRIALNLAELEFTSRPVDLTSGQHRSETFLSKNPQGLVPALEIDDRTITQSLAIIEYLDESGRGKFLPDDPMERQRVRTISYAIAMEIHPVCNLSVAQYASTASVEAIPMQQWMRFFIPKGLCAVENILNQPETGRFCHGDRVTMADICLYPQLYNAHRWDVSLGQFPTIRRIEVELGKLRAFSDACPENFK